MRTWIQVAESSAGREEGAQTRIQSNWTRAWGARVRVAGANAGCASARKRVRERGSGIERGGGTSTSTGARSGAQEQRVKEGPASFVEAFDQRSANRFWNSRSKTLFFRRMNAI